MPNKPAALLISNKFPLGTLSSLIIFIVSNLLTFIVAKAS